jgi:hypothetical protein
VRYTIDDMIAERDRVVTKKTFTGTNTGEFAGMPATGKRVRLQFVDIMRVRDSKIVEHWLCVDRLSWLEQLGLAPGSATTENCQELASRGGCSSCLSKVRGPRERAASTEKRKSSPSWMLTHWMRTPVVLRLTGYTVAAVDG